MQGVNAGDRVGGYRTVLVAAGIGSFIEVYDLFVYGYFASILAEQYFPDRDPTAALLATFAILAVGFIMRPIGGILFGHVGDRFGRRSALVGSVLLMSFATLTIGLLPTYRNVGLLAPVLLLLCRTLQGLSASGEVTGASLFVLEHAPRHQRGRAVATNVAASYLGAATAASTGLVLARSTSPEQLAAWGWRVAFLVAAPVGLIGLYLRSRVMDSPAFVMLGELPRQGRAPLNEAMRTAKRGMAVLTCWAAAVYLSGYLLTSYLPSYLIRVTGLSPTEAFATNLMATLVMACSALLGGYLTDRFPLRIRWMAVGAMAGVAVAALSGLLIISRHGVFNAALVGQAVWAMFQGASLVLTTMLAGVLFAVPIRFTATALATNVGVMLLGSTGPYVATWLVAATGNAASPGIYLFIAAVVGLVVVSAGMPRSPTPSVAR